MLAHTVAAMLSRTVLAVSLLLSCSLQAEDWPQWRGPRLDGRSMETTFPTKWTKTEGVAWRTEIPGGGHASVITFGDKLFTVTAVPETQERLLLCLDRGNGKIRWQQTVIKSPMERLHRENSHASSTPAFYG